MLDIILSKFVWYQILLYAIVTGLLAAAILYYQRNRREIAEKCGHYFSAGQKTWLVWPAIGANSFFDFIFGTKLISVRSLLTTLAISIGANFACLILILMNLPRDFPPVEPSLIKISFYSLVWFITFNFLGDVISLNITRRCVRKIVNREYDLVKYLSWDVGGIIVGYFITLLPAAASAGYAVFFSAPLNPLFRKGILGGVLIPFFLFIFATGGLPIIFGIWACISVFSITIPTAIYLSLMGLCLLGFKISEWWLQGENEHFLESMLKFIYSICFRLVVPIATAVLALLALYRLLGQR